MIRKNVELLDKLDLEAYKVWRYVNSDKNGETMVSPVLKIPVKSLTGKIVATKVRTASGIELDALIGNVSSVNATMTKHFLTLSVFVHDEWIALARYHDFDYDTHGPEWFASKLGLSVDDVFPIHYDLSTVSHGEMSALVGVISKLNNERLTRAEIIALALDD